MLRISPVEESRSEVSLQLEGTLVGPWVTELERTCEVLLARGKSVVLDLNHVGYMDDAGARLFHRLAESNVRVRNASAFVALCLQERNARR